MDKIKKNVLKNWKYYGRMTMESIRNLNSMPYPTIIFHYHVINHYKRYCIYHGIIKEAYWKRNHRCY